MDAKIQAEYDRIKAGPHAGNFTLLHHEGPIIEQSNDVMERVDYTLREKPAVEHYDRLRHIYFVPKLLYADYEAKRKLLGADYEAKRKLLDDEILSLIPDCGWNGKTILP